jgi:hypothetical protein
MMSKWKRLGKFTGVVAICLFALLSFYYGDKVRFSNQLKIYEVVLTLSSIVFAVMGAWLSLLKVEIENDVLNPDKESDVAIKKARGLVLPMANSAIIMVITLCYVFLYYAFKDAVFLMPYFSLIKSVSFTVLAMVVLFEFITLLNLVFSGVDFLLDLSSKNQQKKSGKRRFWK